jgi:hypothetical protein
MINAKDLPAARAQAAAAETAKPVSVSKASTELAPSSGQTPIRSKPSLTLDKGKYYVVDRDK